MSDIRIQKTGEPDILQTSDGRLTLSVPIQIKRRSGRKLVTLPNGETAPVRPWDVAPTSRALCPVEAVNTWLMLTGVTQGPLFPRIDRLGRLSEVPMNPGSINKWLRELLSKAGLPDSEQYSSHSLRRGFAGWANANQWDVKTLMQYVGWRDVQSALRYIDGADPFAAFRATTSTIALLDADLEK